MTTRVPYPRHGPRLRRALHLGAAVSMGCALCVAAPALTDADGSDTPANLPAPVLTGVDLPAGADVPTGADVRAPSVAPGCILAPNGDEECVDVAVPAVPTVPAFAAAHPGLTSRASTLAAAVVTGDTARVADAVLRGFPRALMVGETRPVQHSGLAVAEGDSATVAAEDEAGTESGLATRTLGTSTPVPLFAVVLTALAAGAAVIYLQSVPGLPRGRRKELLRRAMEAQSN